MSSIPRRDAIKKLRSSAAGRVAMACQRAIRTFLLAVSVGGGVVLLGCGAGDQDSSPTEPDQPTVASVEVRPASAELNAFDAAQDFDATVTDSDGKPISDLSVSWSVSPDSVANIDGEGTAIATANGSATIEAETSGVTGSANLTVAQEITQLVVSPDSTTLEAVGDTAHLDAQPQDANGNLVRNTDVRWNSSDSSTVTVDSSGVVKAEGQGKAYIEAATAEAQDTSAVTVSLSSGVDIIPSSLELSLSSSTSLEVEARDSTGNLITSDPSDFNWSTSNSHRATVDASGTVTVDATGQVAITAERNGQSDHVLLNITASSPLSVNSWEGLRPTYKQIKGIWVEGPQDVTAVGQDGLILSYDGTNWTEHSNVPATDLQDLWVSSSDSIWAVGTDTTSTGPNGRVLIYDGSSWTSVLTRSAESHRTQAIWGSSSEDIWVVGADTTAYHFDGNDWSTENDLSGRWLTDIWGASPDRAWVVGRNGSVFRYNGTEWTQDTVPTTKNLYAVWGSSADDIWIGGRDGTLLRYDGQSWNTFSVSASDRLQAIWGDGSGDVWIGGSRGTLLHWNGTTLDEISSSHRSPRFIMAGLHSIHGTSASNVWTAGNSGEILHYDGSSWGYTVGPPTRGNISDVWGSGAEDIWAAGTNYEGFGALLHYDGNSWRKLSLPTDHALYGVWGSGPKDVWIVGHKGTILHYDGVSINAVPSPTSSLIAGIWGSGPNDIWAYNHNQQLLHYNGAEWTIQTAPIGADQAPFDIWGTGPENIWLPLTYGDFLHYDGESWTQVTGVASSTLVALWGSDYDHIWAVGIESTALIYDGTTWNDTDPPPDIRLTSVWGSGTKDVWAVVDGRDSLLHHDGATWNPIDIPTNTEVVWGSRPGSVWTFGRGVILKGAQ